MIDEERKLIDTEIAKKADSATTYSKTDVDNALLTKKNTGTFDTKIQNSTAKTAVSCDGDRYISIKSNGNKMADLHEDTITNGFTIATYDKRFAVVSS